MTKILVADDEAHLEVLIKQKFRRQIREHEYEFIFAINGNDALKKLEENTEVDIVLSDINMPEMDGLTLLTRLSEVESIDKSGDRVGLRRYGQYPGCNEPGSCDFLCKPVNFDDLDITIKKTIQHVAQLRKTLTAIKENNILKMYVDETVLNFMNRREYRNIFDGQ